VQGSLILVLGDQLNADNPALDNFDPARDAVLMVEAHAEGALVWSHQARIALFLSAMRHRAADLRAAGITLHYRDLHASGKRSLCDVVADEIKRLKPQSLVVCEPGEYRLLAGLQDVCAQAKLPLQVREDTHFLMSITDFARWAGSKKQLLMEMFYRMMRKRTGTLMQANGEPEGDRWNFDADNRKGFGKAGPGKTPTPRAFSADSITKQVFEEVEQLFPDHPGTLEHFNWPVTRDEALQALQSFIDDRLEQFGPHQDAMWTDMPWGWHSLVSTSLNLKLLNPREVIDAAVQAYRKRKLDLAGVEGFVRQILGWREFMRGVYWLDMPGMRTANHYGHTRDLPKWYWTGETHMNCMRHTVGQTLRYGFAHHIQRLMVTGNFALMAEVLPQAVEDWYLAVYVDAVEWVELPNVAGMALFANGGRFTTKPYIASGAYIKRMSNYCDGCRYKPEVRTGATACPTTTLYWHFLDKHEATLKGNMRTALMAKNITRLSPEERQAIRDHAAKVLNNLDNL
jgi:deoxyribodipyrimidine photolyase-related protein